MERDFKGVWIPKEVLNLGLYDIRKWVLSQYKVDLFAQNPMQEDE